VTGVAVATWTVAANHMLDLFCFTVASNSAYRTYRAARLKSIHVYEPFEGAGTISNIGLRWGFPGTQNLPTDSNTYYATSSMPDAPARLHCVPNPVFYEGQMHDASDNANIFSLFSLAQNTVIDLDLELVPYETGNSTVVSTIVATGANFPGFNAIHTNNTNITAIGLLDI
jgi:hypothetical protein